MVQLYLRLDRTAAADGNRAAAGNIQLFIRSVDEHTKIARCSGCLLNGAQSLQRSWRRLSVDRDVRQRNANRRTRFLRRQVSRGIDRRQWWRRLRERKARENEKKNDDLHYRCSIVCFIAFSPC